MDVGTNGVSGMAGRFQPPSAAPATGQQHAEGCEPRLPEDALRLGGPLTLLDGRTVQVRAILPDDGGRLCAFHARLSPETIHLRYFCAMRALSEVTAWKVAHVDYERRMAVVATTTVEGEERIIAVVGYEPMAPGTAEVAFVVEDGWQGLGIATELLYALAAYARRHGVARFIANVMPRNARMLSVLRHCGFPYAQSGDECIQVQLDITATPIPS
jgi:RimJ/RimL family protein N-acetyltransferase